jgi:hypothetical protein
MKEKQKVVIALSGETRTWNQGNREKWIAWKNLVEEKRTDVEVLFTGHVWEHSHEMPDISGLPFIDFKIESQDAISEWVREDFHVRGFSWRNEVIANNRVTYSNKLSEKSEKEFIDNILNSSKFVYGQFWSSLESLHYAKDVPLLSKVFKTRWDCFPSDQVHDKELKFMDMDYFGPGHDPTAKIPKGICFTYSSAVGHRRSTKFYGGSHFYMEIPDINIAFDSTSIKNLRNFEYPYEVIDRTLTEAPAYWDNRTWAHILWPQVIAQFCEKIFIYEGLTGFTVNRDIDRQKLYNDL